MNQIRSFDGHSLISPDAIAAYARTFEGAPSDLTAIGPIFSQLDELREAFVNNEAAGAVTEEVIAVLHQAKSAMKPADWREAAPIIATHPIAAFLLQDPFTNWSNRKPRGYSGDAGLLDFVYGHEAQSAEVAAATELGRDIYEMTRNAPSCAAVRERLDILAKYVDQTADRVQDAEVLAVAAGHLRESAKSAAGHKGRIKKWVALDQDPESISVIESCGVSCVEATPGSVRDIIARPLKYGTFDLVYSAGLYDYLEHKVAVKVTQRCLQMLKPGGSYLFANFADDIPEDGYMESFMRWELILRSEDDIKLILEDSIGSEHTYETFFGSNRKIIYAVITRRS
jgi:Methyltransferase domain.